MLIKIAGVHKVKMRLASGETHTYFYHRKTRQRLPDDPTSPAFAIKLAELNATVAPRGDATAGTLGALIIDFKKSSWFRKLKRSTQSDYGRYLDVLKEMWGHFPVVDFQKKHVHALREKFAETPRTSNYFVQVFRLLMSFAVFSGLRESNPASRPQMLETGPGHEIWSDQAIAIFKANAPKPMVTSMMLGLFTGQREGDLLRLPWSSIKKGVIEMVRRNAGDDLSQGKTRTELWIPIHSHLRAHLAGLSKKATVILVDSKGRPYKVDRFRHAFHNAVVDCGLAGLTFHGLRKKATEMLAEAGCTDREIMAITGHRTHAMVARYLDRADCKRRARAAIKKLERHTKGDG